jgi:hypothetical protein
MSRYEEFNVTNLNVSKIFDTNGTAAGAGRSPDIWGDCPAINMAFDPTLGIFVGDDFAVVQTDGFPYNIVGDNGTFLGLAANPYGVARLNAPGTDNDECYVQYNNGLSGLIKADATKNWWFEARVKPSQITLAQGVFIGLAEEASAVGADFMTDNTMALKVLDWIGFQIIAATDIAAVWQTVMALNGGARVAVDSTAGTPAVAWTKLGMKSYYGTVSFYINGAKLDTSVASTATNFPLDQVMLPTFATKCGQATQNTLDIDWWYAAQLR